MNTDNRGSITPIDLDEFNQLTKPLVEYLRKKHNPYCSIIITNDSVKIVEDLAHVPFWDNDD